MIVISGATGFIGRRLTRKLLKGGHEILVLSRGGRRVKQLFGDSVEVLKWDGKTTSGWADALDGAEAVINLAGENLGEGAWTQKRNRRILESRIQTTHAIKEAIAKADKKPHTWLQASAIGYYGPSGDGIVDETGRAGDGFLAEVSTKWEHAAEIPKEWPVRRVLLRSGIVLGREAGALPQLALLFKFRAGGYVGSGKQWMSWIHLRDEVRAIQYLLDRKDLSGGPYNLTAPEPVTMKNFCRELGKALKKPCWLRTPSFAVKSALGWEKAREMVLSGQRVIPRNLRESGFVFQYPDLFSALGDLYQED